MKKVFLPFLAAVAAIVTLPVFAGTDVTSKLVNPDCEQGTVGWQVEATYQGNQIVSTWRQAIYDQISAYGSWGWTGKGLSNYHSYTNGPTDVSQTLTGLQNGTYVFGAYMLATIHDTTYPDKDAYRDDIVGVSIYANGDSTAVCTNVLRNDSASLYNHTRKFNVATTVTDGTLKVGVNLTDSANTNWVGFDNAQLYYFGDVTAEEALLEMGENDLKASVDLATALQDSIISAVACETLQTAIAATEGAKTLDEMVAASEAVRYACAEAFMSYNFYAPLNKAVAEARRVAAKEWSEQVVVQKVALQSMLRKVEKALAEKTITEEEMSEQAAELEKATDLVKVDEVWMLLDDLYTFISLYEDISEDNPVFNVTEHLGFGEDPGQFPFEQEEILQNLNDELNDVMADVELELRPTSDAYAYIAKVNQAIRSCVAVRNGAVQLPFNYITMPDPNDPSIPFHKADRPGLLTHPVTLDYYHETMYCGTAGENIRVETPLLKLGKAYGQLTITVNHTIQNSVPAVGDGPWFNLNQFYLLDGAGNRVALKGSDFTGNATIGSSSGSFSNLVNNNINGFYISRYTGGIAGFGNHSMTITLPEAMSEFKIIMEGQWTEQRVSMIPTEITITGLVEAEVNLMKAIASGESSLATEGTEPGFCKGDYSGLKAALAAAKKLQANPDATEEEMENAAYDITDEVAKVQAYERMLPESGKSYYIFNRIGFESKQGLHKVLTVFQDSILWWDTANPDDPNQRWTLESVEPDDENETLPHYTFKNVGTGKYIGKWIYGEAWEDTGEPIFWGSPYIKMSDTPAKIRLNHQGYEQYALDSYYMEGGTWYRLIESGDNNGTATTNHQSNAGTSTKNPEGYGTSGVCGVITQYNISGVDSRTAWSFVEGFDELPLTEPIDKAFGRCFHLLTGGKKYTFITDKPCAFENFKLTGSRHQQLSYTVARTPNTITVNLSTNVLDFFVSFDNNEGVSTLQVTDNFESKFGDLLAAYEAAKGDYREGDGIGFVKDLSGYNAAMAQAEKLIENGGSDAELEAAIQDLEAAVAALEFNLPDENKLYHLVCFYEGVYYKTPGTAAVCYNPEQNLAFLTYLNKNKKDFYWKFEKGEEPGTVYVRSCATEDSCYLATSSTISSVPVAYSIKMDESNPQYVAQTGIAIFYRFFRSDGYCLSLYNNYETFPTTGFSNLNSADRQNGTTMWLIEEAGELPTAIDETVIDTDEAIAPAAQGIYDLTGRRVVAPASGLYIINGQKVLIK